jgi:MoxR-like ATPase
MKAFRAVQSTQPLRLRSPLVESHKVVDAYIPPQGLPEAMDVSMLLGQPLLVTGDPGTGKTRAAYWLAWVLQCEPLLRIDVKSTSTGGDFLYRFDDVSRFRDSASRIERPLVRYLSFGALGEAILRAAGGQAILYTDTGDMLTSDRVERHRELLRNAFGSDAVPPVGAATVSLLIPEEVSFREAPAEHRVVLVDELDKAPRDTPNDLLAEIDEMQFHIPELHLVVRANPKYRPIVIITSNSEKSLPDPFLRRCVYFDIPFPRHWNKEIDGPYPGEGTLEQIIDVRLGALSGGGQLVQQALAFFDRLRRDGNGIHKRPGTAELLAWLDLLARHHSLKPADDLKAHAAKAAECLGAMLKSRDDLATGLNLFTDWLRRESSGN